MSVHKLQGSTLLFVVLLFGVALLFPWHIYVDRTEVESVKAIVERLRAEVAFFYEEHGRLPGIELRDDRTFADTSRLAEGLSCVQTFGTTEPSPFDAMEEPAAWTADFRAKVLVANSYHFARVIEVDAHEWFHSQFSGEDAVMALMVLREPVQYRVGYCGSRGYTYAAAFFGSSFTSYPPEGTGYAVIEINNASAGVGHVGTWARYRFRSGGPAQIVMVDAEEARKFFNCDTPKQARKMNLCWVGDTEALMSGDRTRVAKAIKDLKQAGWRIH